MAQALSTIFRRVAIYARVSTARQAERGYSLGDQIALCIEYCTQLFGEGNFSYEVYPDEVPSGQKRPRQMGGKGHKERVQVSKLVDDIEAGRITDIVCSEVTRTSRDSYFWAWFRETVCQPYGLTLRFRVGDLDCDDEDDEFWASMQALMGQREAHMTGRRIRDSHSQALLQGFWPYPSNPWGWIHEPAGGVPQGQRRRLVPDTQRAPHLVHMKDRLLRDGWSLHRIADEMQQMGVPSGKTETHWVASVVSRKLTNVVHAGYLEGADGELIEGRNRGDALWDLETHHQILAVLASRRPEVGSSRPAPRHPLSGIIRCASCGRRLMVSYASGSDLRYYRCEPSQSGEARECVGFVKQAEAVERCVVSTVAEFARSAAVQRLLGEEAEGLLNTRRGELAKTKADVLRRVQEKQKTLSDLGEAVAKGTSDDDQDRELSATWRSEKAALEAQLQDVETRLQHQCMDRALLDRVREALRRFSETWEALQPQQQADLLDALLEDVTLGPDGYELVLTIKLHVVPAVVHRLPPSRSGRIEVPGVGAFTERQLALLAHILDGRSYEEITRLWDTTYPNVMSIASSTRGVADQHNLLPVAEAARDVIEQNRAWLPLRERARPRDEEAPKALATRQVEALTLWSTGLCPREIAAHMGIKPKSVGTTLFAARRELGVGTTEEAVRVAREHGLLAATT